MSQGVCDCEDDNHCLERAPWVRLGSPVRQAEPIAPPSKLPDGKLPDIKKL